MNTRERFRAVINFEPFDRLPIIEWAMWWDQTLTRWHREGLPDVGPIHHAADGVVVQRYFGQDLHYQDWLYPRGTGCPVPPAHGAPVIETLADYERIRKYLWRWPAVDLEKWKRWAEVQARGEAILWFTVEGFFWMPRWLMGIEGHMLGFYDQPELIHRINADLAEWMLRCTEAICSVCTPDFMTFAEDMSYNHGPMLSRELFDEFLLPYYQRVIPELNRRGIPAIVDSDGDITTAWQWFEAAGLTGILPLERQAGVDVALLRQRHPRAVFIGCCDKLVMHRGEAAIRAEFERLLPVAKTGGLIISVDHQTPPGVSLADYRLYLRLFHEYAERAGK